MKLMFRIFASLRQISWFTLLSPLAAYAVVDPTPTLPAPPPTEPTFAFDVATYGAVPNGTTLNTTAIQNALNAAGAHAGGAKVDLWGPGTYLTGSLSIPSNVWLHVHAGAILQGSSNTADYPLTTERWEGNDVTCYRGLISADHASHIALVGGGKVNGGSVSILRNPRGPTLFEPRNCQGVYVMGVNGTPLTVSNHSCWTLHPTFCQDVTVSNVAIASDGENSDGCDPDSCARVLIDQCSFSTADDNIAVKSGKNQEGADVGIPTEDVTISNCNFVTAPGFSGNVALGSELSGGIRRVLIKNNTFGSTSKPIYLKSRAGRGGYCTDVVADSNNYANIVLTITANYNSNPGTNPIPGLPGITTFGNIYVTNAVVNSNAPLASIVGDSQNPINGVYLSYFKGTSNGGITQSNANQVVISDFNITGDGLADTHYTKYETETLATSISAGIGSRIIDDALFSAGSGSILDATAVGNQITYTVPNVAAGTYDLRVGVKQSPSRAISQLAVAPAGTTSFVNHGPALDEYASDYIYTEVDLGTFTIGTTGDKLFRFTVTGKNASSTSYQVCVDYLTLIPQ